MFSKGADVDALRDSAGRMASFGREVDVVRARGQRAVSTMQRAWQGPDLQHLVERWRRVEHDLTRISTEFDRLSRRLHDNADLQHRSSGSSAAGGSHDGVGGGGGAVAPAGGHTGGHGEGHGRGHGGRPTLHAASAAAVVAGPRRVGPGRRSTARHAGRSAAAARDGLGSLVRQPVRRCRVGAGRRDVRPGPSCRRGSGGSARSRPADPLRTPEPSGRLSTVGSRLARTVASRGQPCPG